MLNDARPGLFMMMVIMLAALGLLTASARAQPNLEPCAEALLQEGRKAMDEKDYDKACQLLRESNRLDPTPATKYNLANCEEKRGRLATARSV